ncbi:hypothetical protein B0H14DRAFT_3123715, partial [Mycena olivaceomarginata]
MTLLSIQEPMQRALDLLKLTFHSHFWSLLRYQFTSHGTFKHTVSSWDRAIHPHTPNTFLIGLLASSAAPFYHRAP